MGPRSFRGRESMTASLGAGTVHVAVDMQRLFGDATAWHVPSLATVIEPIAALARRHPAQTIFTRFITPDRADDAPGSWRRYYRRWPMVLRDNIDATLLDLVEPLTALVPPAEICDKTT